jgi:hypothetical protein
MPGAAYVAAGALQPSNATWLRHDLTQLMDCTRLRSHALDVRSVTTYR